MAKTISFGGGLTEAPTPTYARQQALADSILGQRQGPVSGWGDAIGRLATTAAAVHLGKKAERGREEAAKTRSETLQRAIALGRGGQTASGTGADATLEALAQSGDPELQNMALQYQMAQLLDPQTQALELKEIYNPATGQMEYVSEADAIGKPSAAPALAKPNETRQIGRNGQIIDQEFDPATNSWKDIGSRAQFAPPAPKEEKIPGIVTLTNRAGETISLRENDPRIDEYIGKGFYEGKPQTTPDATKLPNILRDEFNTLTKDFRTVQDAYSKIEATSDSGAGDMSMLYSYVKLLDPGSVVRESEFATAAASGSFGEQVQGAVQRIMTGERLPPTLRAAFKNEAKNIYAAQKQGYDRVSKIYTDMATRGGINPQDVIVDYAAPPVDLGTGGATPPAPMGGVAPDSQGGNIIRYDKTGKRIP